ncbi:MAG: serine/threonine protein phosphatase [Hyphomonas sp.]|nr:serine/threonine protein phosphatase [Hyphomonas sp.]
MKTAIIGDVHGMLGPLEALVAKLALGPGQRLVFVGDLVDKGPDPAGVVQFVRHLSETAEFETILVEGNHEDKHIRYHYNTGARPGVARAMAEASPELPELDAGLSADDRAFLAGAQAFLRVPAWNVLVVHGGIPGTMDHFPETPEQAAALTGKARDRFRKILRTRHISADDGEFLSLGSHQPGDPFWAEAYDGRFGHVVFGHQPWLGPPACFAHATGIDTAAVHGGDLTALVLPEAGRARFEAVPGFEHRPYRLDDRPPHPGSELRLTRR